jgi:hypothetical protein
MGAEIFNCVVTLNSVTTSMRAESSKTESCTVREGIPRLLLTSELYCQVYKSSARGSVQSHFSFPHPVSLSLSQIRLNSITRFIPTPNKYLFTFWLRRFFTSHLSFSCCSVSLQHHLIKKIDNFVQFILTNALQMCKPRFYFKSPLKICNVAN